MLLRRGSMIGWSKHAHGHIYLLEWGTYTACIPSQLAGFRKNARRNRLPRYLISKTIAIVMEASCLGRLFSMHCKH